MNKPHRTLGIILAISLGLFLTLILPNCINSKITPEEKAIQEAAEATMKAELHQAQIGDFLKFKNTSIGLITNLGGANCFYTTRIGSQGYEHTFRSLSKNVIQIIKQGTPEWDKTAIQYCASPYY